uniref:ribonuclease H n=1 Tax=Podarcis muralis TaxID=64176 RepID=A0A670HL80_PODMU
MLNTELTHLLHSEDVKTIYTTIVSANTGEKAMDSFNELLARLKTFLTTEILNSVTKRAKDQERWFDLECRQARKHLRSTYRNYRNTGAPLLFMAYIDLRRNYKQLLKAKNQKAERLAWCNLVKASNEKDSTSFWRTIRGLLGQEQIGPTCTVEPQEWMKYFQTLFFDDKAQNNDPSAYSENLPYWPPVSIEEVGNLIAQLKNNKAPGIDHIPAELMKNNISWWAPLMASIFTYIDATGIIPGCWTEAVIIPIYKKGPMADPASYRPISLLTIPSKLYAKHLHIKLIDWMETEAVLAEEQAGFRQGRTTIDHCFILAHLIDKYANKTRGTLYAAFIDLKAAFDSISRVKLWAKLNVTNIDKRLLFLIKSLYKDSKLYVRTSVNGQLIGPVPATKGVKQGCILAPALFNLYINDMVKYLTSPEFHAPKLAEKPTSVLLYADDAVLLSRTKVGLKRLLREFSAYCRRDQLVVNHQKTKVMVFARRHRHHRWEMDNQPIEQVKIFKYLGVVFQSTGAWEAHHKYAREKASQSAKILSRFYFTKGGRHIPAALEVFQAKPLAQLLYGAQIWTGNNCRTLETVQSKFLRQILAVPPCAPNAALRLETGLLSVETRTWLRTFNYWLRLNLNPSGLLPLVARDAHRSRWSKVVHQKLLTCGLQAQHLLKMGLPKAKTIIDQRMKDIEQQNNLAYIKKFSAWYAYLPPSHFDFRAPYLSTLTIPKLRRAFTLARLNMLPSAVLEGRYQGISFENRLCPCGAGCVETVSHVLLSCSLYKDLRDETIAPLLSAIPGHSCEAKLFSLLADQNGSTTEKVAKFVERAMRLRAAT